MAIEITIKRTFDAPRELVFKAWTDPKLMGLWWGPHGFTNPVCEMDARPGGKFLIVIRGPAGSAFSGDYPTTGVFHEVEPPSRLVFTTRAFEDENGNSQIEALATVTFVETGGKTEVTLHEVVVKAAPGMEGALEGMEAGWNGSLDKLRHELGYLKAGTSTANLGLSVKFGPQDVVMTRLFDAPPEVVFKAYTDPRLIPQWWGPRDLSTEVDKMEVRAGGIWRFINRDAQGGEYGFHGVYHEVLPSERIVFTFEFEGMPGHAILDIVTFAKQDGKTLLTDKSVYQSVDDRSGMLFSGMELGAVETMDRLAEVLVSLGVNEK